MSKELELEAEKLYPMYEHIMDLAAYQSVKRAGFIEGAISDAAKEYWYKQFEKQKLQFAIEQLKRFREATFGKGVDVIQELEQKLNEL